MTTALITGASSGLGAEFARQLAAQGQHLVLVARDQAALEALAQTLHQSHGVEVEVLAADLLDAAAVQTVCQRVADTDKPIDLLVNNAGFGLPLDFENNDIEAEVAHLRLHDEVPMRLSHAALQSMLARGQGRIINVASVAAFMPRSTYAAAKSWQVIFSRWANVYYRDRGVSVTALCPGFTHTNFHERLGLPPGQEGVSSWMWLNASDVVSEGLRDSERGRAVSIPSFKYRLLVGLLKWLPDSWVTRLATQGR